MMDKSTEFIKLKKESILHDITETISLMWWRDRGNNVENLTESEITDIILDHQKWCKENPGSVKINYWPINL